MTNKRKREPSPIPPPKFGHCGYWIPGKRRYCKLQVSVKAGHKYCGEHEVDRVPCPFTTTHTVAKWNLEKHQKVCPLKPKPPPPYFHENFNLPLNATTPPTSKTQSTPREDLERMSKDSFKTLISRINTIYESELSPATDLPESILSHPALSERLNIVTNRKHAQQQSSLIGHMHQSGLLDKNYCFVEFGAGKAELASYVHKAVGHPSSFILIDRNTYRKKFDAGIREGHNGLPSHVERLVVDIKDVDLSKIELVSGKKVVAFAKHLCGCATDLTLRCLANYQKSQPGGVAGLCFALCCHQICKMNWYPVRDVWEEEWGLTEGDFEKVCVMTSWFLCGKRPKYDDDDDGETKEVDNDKNKEDEEEDGDDEHLCVNEADMVEDHWSGLTFEEREALGYKCKRVIDFGRKRFIEKELGLKTQLVRYVDLKMTRENVCLIAGNLGDV